MLTAILNLLAIAAVGYAIVLVRSALTQGALGLSWEATAVGAVVNFFDTLGIGSFAPTMAWLKIRAGMPDRQAWRSALDPSPGPAPKSNRTGGAMEFEGIRHLFTHGFASFRHTPEGDRGMYFTRYVPPTKG